MRRTLGEPPAESVRAIVNAARQRRLALYLGAGISMPSPSLGPKGSLVADRLRPDVARVLGCGDAELDGLSLEALAQRVANEVPDRLDEIRELAVGAFEFQGIEPNLAHEGVALLMREGLIEAVTVNWDCGVERAGLREGLRIEAVASAADRLQLTYGQLPLYKVHGCATRPSTLALTQDEVDDPQTWAVALVQAALTGGLVVFVGLGTIGLYVAEPIGELLSLWSSEGSTVFVVDPELSDAWRDVLENPPTSHVAMGAEEFVDDLLRSVVADALQEAARAMRPLTEHEPWGGTMQTGIEKILRAFETVTGDAVLRWWRDGVIDTTAGHPFITELPGQKALMTVGLLVGLEGDDVDARGVRGRLTVGTGSRYLEIASRPGAHVSEVEEVVRARIRRRLEEGTYPESRTVTVVVAEAIGQFPARDAPIDIAAGAEDAADLIDGPLGTRVEIVSADDGVAGRLS
jgi:hypothetical protein